MKKFIISLVVVLLAGAIFYPIKYEDQVAKEATTAVEYDSSEYITITAAGDCTLGTDANYGGNTSFEAEMNNVEYNYPHFLSQVKPIFENDDLTIVNFEGTLSNRGERQDKQYAFRGNPEYVKVLTSSSVEAVNLANNHTCDYGESAFSDTKSIMTDNGVLWFEGTNYAITEINGIKVGLAGFNGLTYSGKTQFPKVIKALREQRAGLVIASFHWGVENSYTPTDVQIQLAHSAIDNGADLVIGHHPHVMQGIEQYKGKYILYSMGNFCFGGHKNPKDKDTMVFTQTFQFDEGVLTDYDYARVIPCSISSDVSRNNYQPMPLFDGEFERVKNRIIELSAGFSGIENIDF